MGAVFSSYTSDTASPEDVDGAMKNIILVMIDSLRADHLGCYGNRHVKTPNLDRFGRASMVFEKAVPESLPGAAVRRALLTGRRVFPFTGPLLGPDKRADGGYAGLPQISVPGCGPLPWSIPTMPETLLASEDADTGAPPYQTVLVTDSSPYFACACMNYHRGYTHYEWIRGQLFDAYRVRDGDDRRDITKLVPSWCRNDWQMKLLPGYLANTASRRSEEDYFPARTFSAAINWLEGGRDPEKPFFMMVDCWDPHEPWDPPRKYVDMYDPGYSGIEMILDFYGPTRLMTDKELAHMRALYAGEVTLVDNWFGKFFDRLGELGLLEESLVVVVSDHGHQLGEHGISGKLPAGMYSELMDCVLMVRHPEGVGAGQRCNALVQHHDIYATLMSYAGVEPAPGMDGHDLMPLIEGKVSQVRDYATCGYILNAWCRAHDHVLICRTTGEEPQLFDMKNDPQQRVNIASDKPRLVKDMYGLILADAKGGPIAPRFTIPRIQAARWMDWSPFRPFQMP